LSETPGHGSQQVQEQERQKGAEVSN